MGSVRVQLLALALSLLASSLGPGAPLLRARAAALSQPAADLASGGGPVMHRVSVYTIYWLPAGTTFEPAGSASSDKDYEGDINNFFLDVGGSAWYGVLTQYGDKKGAIQNQVSLVDTVVDSHPYPTGRGTADSPLRDADVRQEVVREIKARHWTNRKLVSHFFVFTAVGIPSRDRDCGFHSDFTYKKQPVIYTYAADLPDTCDPAVDDPTAQENAPTGDPAADVQIDNVAHELAEASTDPLGNGWTANGDYENGEVADVCDLAFPPRDDHGGDLSFSNGDHFYVQALYSNQDGGCELSPGGTLIPQPPSTRGRRSGGSSAAAKANKP